MSFHLLRPEWLLLLVPLAVICWLLWNRGAGGRNWESAVDPALLPHLLVGKSPGRKRWPVAIYFIAGLLAIFALSGPVWEKLPLPVFKQQSALVVALDLSRSMDVTDIKPSRLARARLKLKDLLERRTLGQTALIAYAATAYTVSPLTDDTDTIQALVSSLTTDIMPSQGSRADIAVQQALELFANAGVVTGDILLITDSINDSSRARLNSINADGFRVSILAVGTAQGAPMPDRRGGFIKDSKGSIVIAKTDTEQLQNMARQLGGLYSRLTIDDSDLNRFDSLLQQDGLLNEHEKTDFKADRWHEEGPWFLLLVIPLAALAFQRGLILSLLMVMLLVPLSQPVMAQGSLWERLWKNKDQRAQQIFEKGDAEQAAKLFEKQDWKAAALYKSEQYEQALQQFQALDSNQALYNRANTLARLGRLQEALESYDQVLEKNPQHEDAIYNRDLVEKALKEQQQQQQQQNEEQKSEQSPNEENDDSQQGSNESGSQQSEQQSDQSSERQQSSSPSESEQQPDERQQQQQDKEEDEAQRADKDSQQQDAKEQDEQQSQPNASAQSDMEESLSEQAEQQWLRRIPDDPGGLLRNKFKYQYSRQPQANREDEQW